MHDTDTSNQALHHEPNTKLNELKEKLVRSGGNLSQLHTFENPNARWSINAIEIHHNKIGLCKKKMFTFAFTFGLTYQCERCWRTRMWVLVSVIFGWRTKNGHDGFVIYCSNKLLCVKCERVTFSSHFGFEFELVATAFASPLAGDLVALI